MSLADARCSSLTTRLSAISLGAKASGTAAICGNATLVAGAVTIPTTAVLAGDVVLALPAGAGAGVLSYAIAAGTSITITSSNGADVRVVSWLIISTD